MVTKPNAERNARADGMEGTQSTDAGMRRQTHAHRDARARHINPRLATRKPA